MPPLSVFWPVDERNGGYVLGWQTSNVVVVAGTCLFPNRDDAISTLLRLNDLSSRQRTTHPPLALLGVCSGRGDDCASHVLWQNQDVSDRMHVIHYRRPKERSRRHYSLVGIDLDLLLAIQTYEQAASLNTRHSECHISQTFFMEDRNSFPSGLSPSIINKMNSAHGLMNALHRLAEGGSFSEQRPLTRALPVFLRLCHRLRSLLSLLRKHFLFLCGFGRWIHPFLASAQQLDLRCEQIIFILHQAWLLDYVEETSSNELSAHYISTQNCIWLILNDIIIGSAVGVFLIDNRHALAKTVHGIGMNFTVVFIRSSIFWLDNWPAGLKLNTELSRFLSLIFNALIDMWQVILNGIGKFLPTIIILFGVSGVLGMTMILASVSDLVSLLSIHLSVSYTLVRVAFRAQLLMANSLFNLFRGKRYNILRRRLDDWNYDLDQLLLGAMLLTLTNFLFPTITVYYVLFALSRLAALMLQAGFKVALALLNHFPLFALTLRMKDPWRLPGGVVLHTYRSSPSMRQSFIMQNSPIAMPKIFGQYSALGSRLVSHYSPKRLITTFLKGNRLDPIPQSSIRYTYGTYGPQYTKAAKADVRH